MWNNIDMIEEDFVEMNDTETRNVFGGFSGGVRVAVGDVTGDGTESNSPPLTITINPTNDAPTYRN